MNTGDFLKAKVDVFKGFSKERLQELIDGSRVVSFEANEWVANYGDPVTRFNVLLSGTIKASVVGDGGERKTLGRLKTGATFGELALMTGDTLLADFSAESPCQLLQIPLSLFQSTIMATPEAVRHISRTIAERFRNVAAEPSKAAAALHAASDPYGLTLKSERAEKLLIINCGSSSVKYSFYDTEDEQRSARGMVERIGMTGTRLSYHGPSGKVDRELASNGVAEVLKAILSTLTAKDTGVVGRVGEISLVVHRVVHGGERFSEATVISEEVLAQIESLNSLAPLHNPTNLVGIRKMRELLPSVPHVAVFDTSFHHTLPAYASMYGLPFEYFEKKNIRRYGFHGNSHSYVCLKTAQFLGRRPNELAIVSCHLGNGSSVCAVDHGRSIDTSMGFTPAEGLIMGTRCGDIDSGVLAFLERTEGLSATASEELLNKRSGLLGLSGVSSDMREILKAADEGNHRALLALKAYCYRVRKYIGSYAAALGGLDVVVFTGGIGQGSATVRALALQRLNCMGILLDEQKNRDADGSDEISLISTEKSKTAVLVVPTDEERMMAREALRALSRSYLTGVLKVQKQEPFAIEVSAHHIHLTQEHVEALFGKGHQLNSVSPLSERGPYAYQEELTIVGPKGRIVGVRVLGPTRKATQVEIALTEQFRLGVHPPIRESGDICDSPGCTLEGPAGAIKLDQGVICAWRHIHMTPEDALSYGVRDRSVVKVRVSGDREVVFGDVLVRVDPQHSLKMHIDTDEANAANLNTGAKGYIVEIQSEG